MARFSDAEISVATVVKTVSLNAPSKQSKRRVWWMMSMVVREIEELLLGVVIRAERDDGLDRPVDVLRDEGTDVRVFGGEGRREDVEHVAAEEEYV